MTGSVRKSKSRKGEASTVQTVPCGRKFQWPKHYNTTKLPDEKLHAWELQQSKSRLLLQCPNLTWLLLGASSGLLFFM